ncbi:MAG: PucR family transcriptional regulator ligand-binding domain-containing protein [Paenibacillaceae bacterium]
MITVHEALKRPVFEDAIVVAGNTGLNRKIRWVHILEIPDIEKSIRGGEMILSTGFGLQSQNPTDTYYLQRMIENGVACLCLELVDYLKNIPQEMIDTADRYNFPIIVFNKSVHFVDITQDLHSLILNSHYSLLKKLDVISREFHRLTLTSKGSSKILKLLHDNTESYVVYLSVQGNPTYVPHINDKLKSDILKSIQTQKSFWNEKGPNHWRNLGFNYLSETVGAMGQIWGYLILIQDREYEEFDFLLLDRAVTALSQDLLRKQYMEVRRLHEENLWINDFIHNQTISQQQVKALYESKLKHLDRYLYRVCLIDLVPTAKDSNIAPLEENETAAYMDIAVVARTAFQKYSFQSFIIVKGNQLVTLQFDLNSGKHEKERYANAIRHINDMNKVNIAGTPFLRFGVGRSYDDISKVHSSYEEAKKVLQIQNLNNPDSHLYEDLGVFRLLIQNENENENENVLQSFIHDYLGPVIEHDRVKGSEFLRTLKVYFDLEGSKIHTTEKLHIVRQTLYHRIEKIKELLGEDFMSSDKRLAIEMALKVHQYLYTDQL